MSEPHVGKHEVRISEQVRAPLDTVFAFFADHHQFVSLFGARCTIVRTADGAEPDGVGSIRRIGPGPLSFDEEIVVFERPARIDYMIVRGGPLKHHRGTIRFKAVPDGTEVDYVIRFDSRVPGLGSLFVKGLQRIWAREARKALATLER
jgi:hypothetical protein